MNKHLILILLLSNAFLYGQDQYNAKFALGQNNGWIKLAQIDLSNANINSVHINAKISLVRTSEWGYSAEANIFLRKNASQQSGKWNYIITGTEIGDMVKFKQTGSDVYEIYAKADGNHGHVSIFLNVTKEATLNVTIPSSTTFITNPDVYQDVPKAGNYAILSGNLGIGTINPDSELTVKGVIHAEEVKVDLQVPGPDYVFKPGYELKSIKEVQQFIRENGHLPNIPSAIEMKANGIDLGIMNMKLLEKIEELMLYTFQQQEQIDHLKQEIADIQNQ